MSPKLHFHNWERQEKLKFFGYNYHCIDCGVRAVGQSWVSPPHIYWLRSTGSDVWETNTQIIGYHRYYQSKPTPTPGPIPQCQQCGTIHDVHFQVDPYAEEMHNDHTKRYLCNACATALADEL